MFNTKHPIMGTCDCGQSTYKGECFYIKTVKWDDFISNINGYIEKAVEIWKHRDDFNIISSV